MAAPTFAVDGLVGPVFPTTDGGWVIPAGAGRIATAGGVVAAPAGTPCGAGVKIQSADEVVAFLPAGAPVAYGESPATMAVHVERFAWRIADVLGPRAGLQPGGVTEVDPSVWQGVRVRSVKKTRRSGPPVLVGVGDRDGAVAVVVADRDVDKVLGSVVFPDAPGHLPVPATLPAFDADGDGLLDVFVYGKGDAGVFRARVVIDPGEPVRVAGSPAVGSAPVACP